MKRNLWTATALWMIVGLVLSACAKPVDDVQVGKPYKVAFVYSGSPDDLGWVYEHDRGRKMLEETLGERVKIVYIEDVQEGQDAARVFRRYVQEGYGLIFATSRGYMDYVYQVAEEFPTVKFAHCSGARTRDNMATYFGRMYQPRYLSGIVAGKMTLNGNIGYVAPFPDPDVVLEINAFTLGVRSVNPNARVTVRWTNTWYDPVKEREAATALLDADADIIAQHQLTTEPQKVAQERGMLSIGYNSDMRAFVGDTVLTSPAWNWGQYYIDTVQDALDGNWETHAYWGGMKEGVVQLADFSAKVPQPVRDLVEEAKQQLMANDRIFCGPIKDQTGYEVVTAGRCLSDDEKRSMQFFVEGVVGKIPGD